jgi:hypothetical protein
MPLVWLALLGCLIGAGVYWGDFLAKPKLGHTQINTDATEALAAVAAVRQPPETSQHAAHTHDVPLALRFQSDDDFKQNQHWFETGKIQSSGHFQASMTPLVLDKSCAANVHVQHASLEAAISEQLGFDVSQAVPEDILVEDFAQFWTQNGRYFKLGARWDRRLPALYEINFFSAADAAFASDVQNLPLPMAQTGKLDVISFGEFVERVLAQAEKSGAVRGARLVHARPNMQGPAHDLKLSNGRPVSWAFGTGRCQLRNSGSAFCKCAVGAELAAIDHSAVPVVDINARQTINPEAKPKDPAQQDENYVID